MVGTKKTNAYRIDFDVIVVGGGHAGIEATMAAARLGCTVGLVTMDPAKIGQMSCNPAIGGTAKGHVVREIDALGGVMARLIDETGIQFKMLNTSKGPAMWSPRAQADRKLYQNAARHLVSNAPNVTIITDIAAEVVVENGHVVGLRGESRAEYRCSAVIVSSGTFLRGLMHTGLKSVTGGRVGEAAANVLSDNLRKLGFRLGRLKTGTPPRVDGTTIYRTVMKVEPGHDPPPFFSFSPPDRKVDQVPCWLTYTNDSTHETLRSAFDLSPLFTGRIEGVGPRYCPSIEDKVARFPERIRHQIFIEPEGLDTDEVYVNGFATSLPEDTQYAAIHTIRGMEEARITSFGYAIEYDFVPPEQLYATLETKPIKGLFMAGQVCGTSGYEEAAGQGLVAGINAARSIAGEPPFVLHRHEAYIGVMIDDLVTIGVTDPYRLFTSRAEHRLLLRQDNADVRLADRAREVGMIDDAEYRRRNEKKHRVSMLVDRLHDMRVSADDANRVLEELDTALVDETQPVDRLLRRPEIGLRELQRMGIDLLESIGDELVDFTEWTQAEFAVKYVGYLKRQEDAARRQAANEKRAIPDDFDYTAVPALSSEAKEKLRVIRPMTFGQASRVPGITPADLSVIAIALERQRRERSDRGKVDS